MRNEQGDKMKCEYYHDGQVAVMELQGSLTVSRVDALSRDLTDWLHANSAVKKLVLDMQAVDMIDSSGMAVMISVLKKMTRSGGDIVVSELSPTMRMLFEVTRLQKIFEIFDTTESAIKDVK